MPRAKLSYVLITPARNEESNIERVISSVTRQTAPPLKWVIVDDASEDRTAEIVRRFLKDFPWLELVTMPSSRKRSFSAKVECFDAGYGLVRGLDFDIVGNLDADVSFDPGYIEFLLERFAEDPSLGVAGTPFVEDSGYSSLTDSFEGQQHVPGGCQLFRRRCFEEIGGYAPHPGGGIDWIAVTTARMKGWKTRSFLEKFFHHHRSLGTADSSVLPALFHYGKKDYFLGNHPVWELLRVLYRMAKAPYVVGGLCLLFGYAWACAKGARRPVSAELMRFHRREEMAKLKMIIKSVSSGKKLDKYTLKMQ